MNDVLLIGSLALHDIFFRPDPICQILHDKTPKYCINRITTTAWLASHFQLSSQQL